jgi:hypothetical protein
MFVSAARRIGAILLLGLSREALAQADPHPLITTLPVSVRFAGLGGAAVGISGDAGAIFTNPASLATIRNIAVEGALQRYPDGTVETMGAAAFRLLQFDIGGGYHYLNFSDTSSVRANLRWVAGATYRFGIFALGASTNYVSQEDSLGKVRRSAGIDAGLGIYVFDLFSLSLAVRNLSDWNVSGGGVALPRSTATGFTFNFVDPQLTARMLATMEVIWTQGSDRRTVLGAEAGAVLKGLGIVGRIGYGAAPDGAGQKEVSYGGGVLLGRVNLDYAYQRRTKLGDHVHRFGARFTL